MKTLIFAAATLVAAFAFACVNVEPAFALGAFQSFAASPPDLAGALTAMGCIPAARVSAERLAAVRGPIGPVRADGGGSPEAVAAINKLMATFEEFKTKNDERLKAVEKGLADPVNQDATAKLNAEMDKVQAELTKIAKDAAAAKLNGGGAPAGARDMKRDAQIFYVGNETVKRADQVTDEMVEQYGQYREATRAAMRQNKDMLSGDVLATLRVGQDSEGGFLVPTEVSDQIITRQRETSDVRSIANVIAISTDKLVIPLDVEEASSGGWVSEQGSRKDTDTPGLGEQTIETFEQYAQPKATQRLLDDAAVNIEAWLAGKIADILGRTENTAFVTGNGVGKPKGFLGYAAGSVLTADAARDWGKLQHILSGVDGGYLAAGSGDLPADPIIDLIYALKPQFRANARHVMNRASVSAVRKLKDGDGNYLWQPALIAGQPSSLVGYPIAELEDMPDIASGAFAHAFGDFGSGYTIVDRQAIRVLRDPYTQKPFVKFYTTKRVGADVTNFDAIKLLKFSQS